MGLNELHKGARILETIENYSIADNIISDSDVNEHVRNVQFYEDEKFWRHVSSDPSHQWGMDCDLHYFVLSDWVARVPGLYWSPTAKAMRKHKQEDVVLQSEEWTVFRPIGKSKKVLGGIGTLMLPPTDEGKVLMSASAACNASTGIPLLLYPDVYERLKIKQGDCVIVKNAKWRPMDLRWASKFASTKDIPRGYLVVDSIDKLIIVQRGVPVVYHPFSLMEYEYQNSLFYDFVYVTADSKVRDVDTKIERFFSKYAKADGRNGEYLLNPNVVCPIFNRGFSHRRN